MEEFRGGPISRSQRYLRLIVPLVALLALGLPGTVFGVSENAETLDAAFDGRKGAMMVPRFKTQGLQAPRILGAPVPGNEWVVSNPDDGLEDDNPSAPDRIRFWDKLQEKAFDQICRNIKLGAKQKLELPDYGGVEVRMKRYLKRYPTGRFALVDEGQLSLRVGSSLEVVEWPDGVIMSVSLGAVLSGGSTVVRPLKGEKSCKEIGKLLNLFTLKTVLPVKPNRIKEMREGELWKLPVSLRLSGGAGVGTAFQELPISIHISGGTEDRTNVTLYRMGPKRLRVRMRFDRAELRDKGGQVLYILPTVALGLPAADGVILNFLYKQLDRQVGRQLNRYTAAKLGLSHGRRDGRQVMLEYILDPDNEEQMKALVGVLKGELNAFNMLWKMSARAKRLLEGDVAAREEIEKRAAEHAEKLGAKESFAGVDDSTRERGRFHFQLPFLVDYRSSGGIETDRYVLLDERGGEYDVRRADKASDSGWIDLPLLGQLNKHSTHQAARVFTYKDARGRRTAPMAVYTLQEGFLRESESSARSMARRADNIIKYAGVRGEGINPDTTLPVDELFPNTPRKIKRRRHPGRAPLRNGGGSKMYRRGVMVFTVAFSMKAIRDILFSDAETVMRAFANTLGGDKRIMMGEVLKQAKHNKDGSLDYSSRRVARKIGHGLSPHHDNGNHNVNWEVRKVAGKATKIVQDLLKAREAATPEAQSAAFLEVLAGKGKSGVAFEEIVRVLIQLVNPVDMSAEFFVRVDKKLKGEEDVDVRYLLNNDQPDRSLLGSMSRTVSRFAEPSILTD